MHRLVSANRLYHTGLQNISTNAGVTSDSLTQIRCSFCQKILLGQQNLAMQLISRQHTTRVEHALQKSTKKKVKYKNYKKYGELLEVNENTMTQKKVSISKLHAEHLSKLATSPISLGELHQLTKKTQKKPIVISEVDPDLLKKIQDKILNRTNEPSNHIHLEDDKCALVFTTQQISSLQEKLGSKEYIQMIKDSYYNFRKTTLYDQRLQDLHSAINEGLNQEFDFSNTPESGEEPRKGPHAIFRELFFDNQLDTYDHELMNHISNLQSDAIAHPGLDENFDDVTLDSDIAVTKDALEFHENQVSIGQKSVTKINTLKVKKTKEEIKLKKKALREKRRAFLEVDMKEELKVFEGRGKQEGLHLLLAAHLQLLCSLNMTKESYQVLQYFRSKARMSPDRPKVTDVKIYNILLHGYAANCQLNQAQELLAIMEQDNIAMNAQTFAALFEAVERSDHTDKLRILRVYQDKMTRRNIKLNDLLDHTIFQNDQHQVVLNAVRRIDPEFVPNYTPPNIDYVCPLLEKLTLDKPNNRQGLEVSPAQGLLTVEELKERIKRQLRVEIDGDIVVKNISVEDNPSNSVNTFRGKLNSLESEWRVVIKEAFIRNLSTLKSQSNASSCAITTYPYLKVLEVDQFVDIMMGEINKLVTGSESYSQMLRLLQRELGATVYDKYLIEQYRRNGVLNKIEKLLDEYCEWYLNRSPVDDTNLPYNSRQVWQMLMHKHREGASLDLQETPWPLDIRQNVGMFLYNIIINDLKIDVNMFKSKAKKKLLPAVYRVHRPWGKMVRLELKPHPVLARLWSAAARPELSMRAPLAPLCCPPRPWHHPKTTTYLLTPVSLIRLPINIVQQSLRLDDTPPSQVYPLLDSLNQLGEVPWVINKPVLDLQLKIFRSGGDKNLEIPQPPSSLDVHQFETGDSKASVFRRRVAISRARAEMYSLWCDALYKLSLANHYRDEIFWLPHNMDFRGRVYACPPHLSQLGSDNSRALLEFATKKPLGPDGLRWLKLHAMNLTGTLKKSSIEERLAYAESILDKILDSADRPLDGERWWTESEEPWQTLACCMEIANAMRSPNAAEYMSGFPVQQDGSCNGLQHYAALGLDAPGAAAVNLAPGDRPRDVYTAVADKVEEMRAKDAAQGVPAAIALEGFVRRKVIKQTVMTTVYGVTRFGARLQIAKQLKDIEDFPKNQVWACSQYLTARTFDSLREMFTSTKLIQDWLTECAKVISSVCGSSVEWVTPLGLPVLQPYYKKPSPNQATPIDLVQRPCTMKQRNAFPPNFIHSLDSSHMMLTSLHCQAAGVSFISVHDCFWTHPQTAHIMNEICREQFVALHSQPILSDLSDYLTKRFSYNESEISASEKSNGPGNKLRVNTILQKVPTKGDFKLEEVLKSVYFFS